jgi:hypothetical protein
VKDCQNTFNWGNKFTSNKIIVSIFKTGLVTFAIFYIILKLYSVIIFFQNILFLTYYKDIWKLTYQLIDTGQNLWKKTSVYLFTIMYATKRNLFVLNHYVFFRFNEFLLTPNLFLKAILKLERLL